MYQVFHAVFPMYFFQYHTLYQLTPTVSDCVAKAGELAAHTKSRLLSDGVQLCQNTLVQGAQSK